MKKLHRQLARPTSLTAGRRMKKRHKKNQNFCWKYAYTFSRKHLKQRGPLWTNSHVFKHPKVLAMQKSVSTELSLVRAIREPGLEGTAESANALPLSVLIFLQVSAQQQSWGCSLCSPHSNAPQLPMAGRDRGNAESRFLPYSQHSASLSGC